MKRSLLSLILLIFPILSPMLTRTSLSDQSSQLSKLFHPLLPPAPKQDVAFVAALDGTLYLVDTKLREIKWSFSTGKPIYSSYQASLNNGDDKHNASELRNDLYYIDCDDDWELAVYSRTSGKLQSLSLSADEYIKRTPHVSEDGEITLGLKKTTAFLVDAKTGKVLRTYKLDTYLSKSGALDSDGNALLLAKDAEELVGSENVDLGAYTNLVYVTRTDYVLQHYSPNTSEVLWNVAFADIEAEFRCQGLGNSFGGISLNADTDEIDWELPCQIKTAALRIRDHSLLDFDKLAIAHVASMPQFLPVADNIPLLGRVHGLPPPLHPLPVSGDMPLLALPSSEATNIGALDLFGGNTASPNTEVMVKSHLLPAIGTVLSVIGFVFYALFVSQKHSKRNKLADESTLRAGMPKKRKNRKSGNSKNSSNNNDGRQNSHALENEYADPRGFLHIEENERKLLPIGTDLINEQLVGRKVEKSLIFNKEIAKGSNGTVVLEGMYNGRTVAVKRLLRTHHDVASKEIRHLIASDQHPNIVRFYGVEYDQDFVYLVLERCFCSLSDLIYVHSELFQSQLVSKDQNSNFLSHNTVQLRSVLEDSRGIELWRANGYPSSHLLKLMRDVVVGLAHLHELGIIHRDLKPQNVLIVKKKKSFASKISDMGISKLLNGDMSSLTQHPTGYGSSGWQAPEQLLHGRQSRAVDLFSLGCVLFFCVTGGKHPFGDNIERDVNIVKDQKDLFLIEHIPEAVDLFSHLLDTNPDKRPKAQEVVNHPLFWTSEKRLSFLQDVSDRVELEDRQDDSEILDALESIATTALNGKWDEKMEAAFINNIGRYRRYKFDSIRDLLRVIRNKSHHYRELPQEIRELLGSHPEGFENYFSSRFPKLLIEVYKVIHRYCKEEEFFVKYVESSII